MGYKLLYDKQILFDVYSGDYVTDAQLSMSVNAVSYFDFTISLTHSLYDIVSEHAGIVELYFDDAKLFSGEITEISVDLNGNKDITCAGALDYLSYTLVRPYSTIDGEADLLAPSSVDGYFNWLIEQHNKHCLDSRKHFFVGVNQGNLLDNNNYIYRASSELPTTSSEIEDKILNSVGGYLYVRYKDDKNILDLYADTHEANTQIIDFGVNITDFVKTTSTDDQYTAVIATGYTPDPPKDDPQKKMNPITLEGCVDGGTPYSPSIVKMGDVVYDVNAVARYGYKEYHVSNDDIKTYDGLLQYACKVLNKLLSPALSVSVKAVDLSLYMKDKYEHMQVGQAVRVRSKLHNIDEYLVVNSITLDMNNPENTEYQLGESYDTLTGQQSSYLRSLNSSIVSNLDSVAKLDSETKKNAKDIADTKVVASNAANKANKASEDATNAVSKSSEAIKNANEAKDTANSAVTEAGKATEAANSANTKADQATDLANSAKQEASAANDIASEAKKVADKAQADTNTNTKAVAQAQSTADAAKKAAADAQEKAENVESNLESSNSVIEQHSNKLGELDTKVSNAVTNANSALTASTEAKQTATEASTTANTAYKDSQTAITNSTKATQTATEAKTTAESAVSTANDSLRQSSSAVQTANRIENTLTTEYQTKADSDALYATKSSLTETSESIKMEVSATYATKSTVEALQNVADNAIESWRGSGIPTSENKPASDWTTIEEKKRHSGDLYYDKDTGKAYRWGSDDGVIYSWVLNQDTDITKALQDASNAQKSANDAQSTANGAVTAAGNAQKSAEGAQSTADSAKTAAANAQKTADTVQLDVDQLKIDIPGTYATKASLETTAESITAQVESVSTTANSAVTAASKAQQTADAINVNLTKNYQTKENADNTYATKASLSATSEGLSASITKAQQTADGAVNAASNAQQTADAININLTKNYQTTKDADDKYATQSSLNATADSITASVSKTYSTKTELSSAIDGISVGGRNLLLGTATFDTTDISGMNDHDTALNNSESFRGNSVLKYNKAWNKYYIVLSKFIQKYNLKGGDFVTYSIWFKFTTDNLKDSDKKILHINSYNGMSESENYNTLLDTLNVIDDANIWKQYSISFKVPESISEANNNIRIECDYYTESDYTSPRLTQWWSSPKLEFGNKDTDWSPAPEDIVASTFNEISVGGRNLLTNTGDGFQPTGGWAQESSTWVPKGYYEYWYYDIPKTDPYYETKIGDVITISFDAEVYVPDGSSTKWLTLYDSNYTPSVSIGRDTVTFPPNSIPKSTLVKVRGSATRTLKSGWANELRGIEFYCGYGSGRYFKISKLKIELGNKPTDWSPAPEDLVAESKTYTDAQIKVSADSITSTVSQTYLKNEDASKNYASSERVSNIESRVTQNVNSITASFNSLKKQIDDKTEVVNAWITEGSDGTNPYLELGTNKSDLKTRLTNSELAFMDGTDKVAYISNNTMSITNADIDIAEINQLAIYPYQLAVKNGHLLIQYIGG